MPAVSLGKLMTLIVTGLVCAETADAEPSASAIAAKTNARTKRMRTILEKERVGLRCTPRVRLL